jgi:predicted MFS family arabinose efflux permease
VPWVMTVLWLMVPPALRNVSPKTAKKMIGAITLLKAKKYWTLVVLVGFMNGGGLQGYTLV